jgi:hypothetical protein
MNSLIFLQRVLLLAGISSVSFVSLKPSSAVPGEALYEAWATISEPKMLVAENDLINDALAHIKSTLVQSKRADKRAKPCRVVCLYQIIENKAFLVKTKIYYSNYRKKPHTVKHMFVQDADARPDRVVEIIYTRNNKNYISVIDKSPKNIHKRLRDRCIKIPHSMFV